MLELYLARQRLNQISYADPNQKLEVLEKAQQLYHRATLKGQIGWVWSKLSGRSRALLDLNTVLAQHHVVGRYSGGTRVVRVEDIRGSVDRPNDFDRNFNPRQAYTERRWVNLAVAWLNGVTLPPVKLIQVGDDYFVEDGHHRVSVARALGQDYLEAEVTVWAVRPNRQRNLAPCLCGAMG